MKRVSCLNSEASLDIADKIEMRETAAGDSGKNVDNNLYAFGGAYGKRKGSENKCNANP